MRATELLSQSGSASATAAQYAQVTSAVARCNTGTFTSAPLPIPNLPPTSTAYALSKSTSSKNAHADIVVGHKGTVLWILVVVAATTIPTAMMQALSVKAVAKITA